MAKKTKIVKPVDYSKPLKNAKHERFCQEWVKSSVNCFNNTLSYQVAYPLVNKRAAEQSGSRLLSNV